MPTPNGSISDITCKLSQDVTVEDVNGALKQAAEGQLKGVMEYSEDPLVLRDIIGNPSSAIIDSGLTLANGKYSHGMIMNGVIPIDWET